MLKNYGQLSKLSIGKLSQWYQINPKYLLYNTILSVQIYYLAQGFNARKVNSEVYASFVLQCTVTGRYGKHKTDVEAWHGIHLSHNKAMKYSGHRKLLCELSKFNAFNLLGYYTDTEASFLVYKFRPERTGFNMYARRVNATAINFPCITFLT